MSINAEVSVLSMAEELTSDEFRLLMIVAQTSADDGVALWPNWETVIAKTRLSANQCNRILNGLRLDRIIWIGSPDPETRRGLEDPNLSILAGIDVHISIEGM